MLDGVVNRGDQIKPAELLPAPLMMQDVGVPDRRIFPRGEDIPAAMFSKGWQSRDQMERRERGDLGAFFFPRSPSGRNYGEQCEGSR